MDKRKDRLKKILGAASYAMGGMIDSEEQMGDMDFMEDDFLSDEDKESEIDENDPIQKRKARLFALLAPKVMRKR